MALFAAGYYGVGMLFVLGDTTNPDYAFASAVFGLLGICAPVFLCGVHLMFFGKRRAVSIRALMVGTLVLTLVTAILAMLPHLLATPPVTDAGYVIQSAIVMSCLFGWPLVAGLFHALLSPAR